MNQHSNFGGVHRYAVLWVAIFVIGCSGNLSDNQGLQVEEVQPEPTQADAPNLAAIAEVEKSLKSSSSQPPVAVAEWPALFGANRTSVSDSKLNPIWPASGPKMIWEVASGTGYGSPVAAAERVIFNTRIDDDEILACHDVSTGDLRWQYRQPTTLTCDYEYSNGPYSTPIIDDANGRVFNVGGQGVFTCVDLETGDALWTRDLHLDYEIESDIFPVGASPLLDSDASNQGGQLIFNLGAYDRDAGIISLDASTGKTLWHASDQGPSYGTPYVATIHNNRFAFVLTEQGLVSLDPDTGAVDWFYEFYRKGDLARNATSPMVVDDKVVLVCCGIGAACLKIQPDRSYVQHWRERRTLDSQYNTIIRGDKHLYSFTSAGQGGAEFRCIETETGKMSWRYRSLLKRGMGVATKDAILLLGERGHLASLVFTPEEPRVLAFTEQPLMSEPCYCSPAIYGTTLILKDETRVAAFDLSR